MYVGTSRSWPWCNVGSLFSKRPLDTISSGNCVWRMPLLPDGSEATTPVVPVIVGADWPAVLLWKALFEAGVDTNVALHPAVPPGGALLRTSLMATHEREHLDRAL